MCNFRARIVSRLPLALALAIPINENFNKEYYRRRRGGEWNSILFSCSRRERARERNLLKRGKGIEFLFLNSVLLPPRRHRQTGYVQGVQRRRLVQKISKERKEKRRQTCLISLFLLSDPKIHRDARSTPLIHYTRAEYYKVWMGACSPYNMQKNAKSKRTRPS